MKKPIVVNFYGGPGTGKSTMAAAIFSELKSRGINCELVTEYAKKKVWEESHMVFEFQLYISAKQMYSMFTVAKHVDIVITDSPIIMASVYAKNDKLVSAILKREHAKYNNIEIFLKRVKEYNPKGRLQTEGEAKAKDIQIKNLLNKNKISYNTFDAEQKSIKGIVDLILKKAKVKKP
jgi:nicotinamide riboside kinase